MSSTYAIRQIDHYFNLLEKSKYYYKECAINARTPENEADPHEKIFLEQLAKDPKLVERAEVQTLNGQPVFVIMRRGLEMEKSCLRCHSTPDRAPGDLVKIYGPTRSFGRLEGEVIHAISIRIPLAEAYGQVSRLSWQLSGILVALLGCLFASQTWIGKRWLFDPMAALRQKALEIAESEARLGETIPVPAGAELRDLTTAFNAMSRNLRQSHDSLEERVRQRTAELHHLNERLEQDILQRQQTEEALRESEEKFRNLFNNSGVAMFRTRLDGSETLDINEKFLEIVGRTRAETQGTPSVIFWEEPTERDEMVRRLVANGRVSELEFRMVNKQGEVRDCITSLVLYREQGILEGTIIDITERKKAQEALLQSQQHLKSIFRVAPVGIGLVFNRVIQEANETLCRMTRYTREQLVGQSARMLYPSEEEYNYVGAEKYRQIAERGTGTVETRWKRQDGEIMQIILSSTPLDATDLSKGVTFTALDITERKRAEENLKNQIQFTETLLETIPIPVFYKDVSGRYLGCNRAFEKFWGKPREEVIGHDVYAMGPKEIADKYAEMDQELLERPGSQMYEWKVMAANGLEKEVIFYKASFLDASGKVGGLIGVILDITARKQSEEALRKAEERYRSIFANAIEGIFQSTPEGRFISANTAMAKMFGYASSEDLMSDISDIKTQVYADPQRRVEFIRLLERDGIVKDFEYQVFRKDGSTFWISENARSVENEKGEIYCYEGFMQDITERQRAEVERLKFSKLESLGTLAGGIAHDFNNILTGILGNIGLAMLNGKIEPQVQERLAQAEQACIRAQALSRQLLTFAKGGAPIKKMVSLAYLLKESAILTLSGSKSRCDLSIPEDLWLVEADEGQLSQVINNLLINADQAMPEGGIIQVSAENCLVKAETDLPISKGKYVKFAIADQGIGISPKYLDKIFDPYFSTKQKGSGLGLATAYSIIKNHSGHIQIESQQGVGTTFHIYLPAIDQVVPAVEPETAKLAMGQGKILVMDDEEIVREVLGRLLSRLGYEADFAGDGTQAIEKFVKAQESGRPFAAVILDLTIPGGMGGKETIEQLLRIDQQTKAIVSSGYSDDPVMADFQKYGFSEVIAKPYRIVELSQILQGVISKKDN
ncbi:MAG: PAS domain S-box protein [Deltaproteobacteria bacterium]|nr:PAS domain S-box protein [Deltaproteobacteria bacterium]